MCGIWATLGTEMGRAPLARMAHRGPDGEGFATFDVAGTAVELGHLRLAIIDLDERANQPFLSADGRYALVFNGEIYNYLELREDLLRLGCTFRTQSDTEVLLQAWATWQEACLPRLTGMFAFAVLDKVAGELVLARDPFGIKPLYYARTRSGWAVSSEIPPLLDAPGVSSAGDAEAAYRFALFGLTDGDERTLFRDVRSFPAAHVARLPVAATLAPAPQRYWAPSKSERGWSFAEAASAIRDGFLENVRLHLRSDVPVGAALSGGIDSSAIVAGMRAVGGDGLEIRSFSFVAPGHAIDESAWIDLAAAKAGAASHTVTASAEDLVRDLDDLVALQGEPFGSTSIYAQYRVMRLARENGIKVMLDGQGSDELFAGYRPYLAARFAEDLRAGRPDRALAFLLTASRLPQAGARRIALQGLGALPPQGLVPLARRLVGKSLAPDWLDAGWLRARGVRFTPPGSGTGANVRDRLIESLTTTVLPALLRYEDRNSMRFSIESRVPFLTTSLADLAYACPASYLISDTGETKAVFRAAMRGLVPDVILDRRDKIGFATPESAWLGALGPWAEAVLSGEGARRVPFLRGDIVAARLKQSLAQPVDGDFQVWRWLNLVRWAERFDVDFT
jgi:asparagine synthase (glutamine-hydrolysing)